MKFVVKTVLSSKVLKKNKKNSNLHFWTTQMSWCNMHAERVFPLQAVQSVDLLKTFNMPETRVLYRPCRYK